MVIEEGKTMEFFSTVQMLILSVVFLLIPLCMYPFFLKSRSKPSASVVGFKVYPFIGVLPELYKNSHRFLEWTTEVLSHCPTNTYLLRAPGTHSIFTANPLNVEHIFRNKSENYIRDQIFTSVLEDLFGQYSPLTSNGQIWKNQRKVAGHEFNTKSLRNFWMENLLEIQTLFISVLENAARTGKVLDLQHVLHCFSFDNIYKLAVDVDLGCLREEEINDSRHEFMHAFEEAIYLTSGRFNCPLKVLSRIKKFLNVGSEKRLKKSTKIVHEYVEKQINARLEGRFVNISDKDFLSRFMEKGSGNIGEHFVRDNLVSLIFAGGDTVTSALTWFFWLLSLNPHVKKKIRHELEDIRFRKTKNISDNYDLDDLQEMNYLHAAISESMRLYPPKTFGMTLCKEDDILPDGTFVGKNWTAGYNAYAMGRMEQIWGKDCGEYKPERWLENGIFKPESPFRFPIFHVGPRMCLGKDLAYIEMKSIAAVLLERFELEVLLESGKPPEYLVSITFRMKDGLPVRVKERFVK